MPTTYVDYTATAAQTDFAFTFPYLEDEHVVVEIDGVQKTLTTDYTIVTSPSTKIVLTSGATAGQVVRVRRKSQPGTDLVDFENGSVLTESELDRAYLHNRYLNEEIGELNDASLQKEAGGTDWDAGGSKIKNVGTPTLTADATTKQYVDDKVNQVSSGASSPPTKWVFTGDAGANTTYSVTGAEVNGDTAYDVSVDGSVLEPTTDYTVNPDTDTLTIVSTLSGGEDIVVIERGFGVAITGTIGADQLQTNSVSTAKIQNDAVDNSKIADDSIDSEHYVDESIDTAHLADHSVTAVKISNTDSKFNVQTDGKVGIGTNNPQELLNLSAQNNGEISVNTVIRLTDIDTVVANPQVIGRVEFESKSSTDPGVVAKIDVLSTASNNNLSNGNILFYTGENASGLSESMRIDTAGKVGIGTGGSPSAPLEVSSTTGGVVFPRLTTTQRDAISTPTDGETIFNTTTNQVESWNGSIWEATGSVDSSYSTGWVNTDGSTSVADAASLTFTHNLGTTDLVIQVYVADDSSGTNSVLLDYSNTDSGFDVGGQAQNITTTTVDIQLGADGFGKFDSSGNASYTSFDAVFNPITNEDEFKYIKVVVIR